jgi:hypothetical protein
MLRALRNANLLLQNEREISAGLVEKLLNLDRPITGRFYSPYPSSLTPISRYPNCSPKNGFRRNVKSKRKNHHQAQ